MLEEFLHKKKITKHFLRNEATAVRKDLKRYMRGLAGGIILFISLIILIWILRGTKHWEVMLLLLIFTIYLSMHLVWILLRFFNRVTYEQTRKFLKFPGYIAFIFSLILLLIFAFKFVNNTISETSLANLENIDCIIQSDAFPEDSHELLYYNDKYIFVEEIFEKERRVRVLPFDSFFKNAISRFT